MPTPCALLCGRLRTVTLREFFLENFAGDLEYHPRRAMLYLGLAVATMCFWIFSAPEVKFMTIPLIFGLGSLTCKSLPSLPNQAAQIVQDFGVGALVLWPLLNAGKDIDHTWVNPPRVPVFLTAAVLLGWLVRRLTSAPSKRS